MLRTVEGYFNGTQIIPNEKIDLQVGQRVIITVPDPSSDGEGELKVLYDICGNPISPEELLQSLLESEEEIENGEYFDAETIFKELSEKYGYKE